MSNYINVPQTKRLTVLDIEKLYKNQQKIVALTSYCASVTPFIDEFCDFILVGDSVGMVVYGLENTLPVTTEMMIWHAKAVVNSSSRAMIVVDMPFSSYEESPQQAYRNAAKILAETNCTAVKIEGGITMAPTIEFLTKRGIPVMSHIGLTPQYVNVLGGFKSQGRTKEVAERLKQDAKAVEEAGSFAIVLEAVIEPLAREIVKSSNVPVIGIGASVVCDGQILVTEDMLGFFQASPKFVRKYADLGNLMRHAIKSYAEDVRQEKFPEMSECYEQKNKS